MSEDFDPSPRASKRRRVSSRSHADELPKVVETTKSSSILRSVSNGLSGLSRKLFESGKPRPVKEIQDQEDSTYGSKEDSLVENEQADADNADLDVQEVEVPSGPEGQDAQPPASSERLPPSAQRKTTKTKQKEHGAMNTLLLNSPKTAPASKSSKQFTEDTQQGSRATRGSIGRRAIKNAPIKNQSVERRHTSQAESEPQTSEELLPGRTRRSHQQSTSGLKRSINSEKASEVANGNAATPEQDHAEVGDGGPLSQQKSNGRNKRRPGRHSTTLAAATEPDAQLPKGILTPSKKEKKGVRKSVVFDEREKEIEKQLGFKDIDTTGKKGKQRLVVDIENAGDDRDSAARSTGGKTTKAGIIDELNVTEASEPTGDDVSDHNFPIRDPHYEDSLPVEDAPDNEQITAIKSIILSRLSSRTPIASDLSHLEVQYNTLHTLLTSTIASGESNSLLLLGSRGSGKSLLVKAALADLSTHHRNDFHIVRLNGFIQTDDKLALREIWRQLGREMQVDETETNEVSSYADTMASLLGLLAHPEELEDPQMADLDPVEGTRTTKSVVFVLDEFDLFTTHPRQTLLYNLFDIAQARKAPIAVIGCSARMDVIDCLEKRVKSRFSHRWVYIPSAKSLSGWEEVARNVLCLDVREKGLLSVQVKDDRDLLWGKLWNEYIQTAFLPSSAVQTLLKQTYHTTKSFPDLFAALYIPIATSSIFDPLPTSKAMKSKSKSKSNTPTESQPQSHPPHIITSSIAPPSSIVPLLPHLPTLHLTLLTSATRLESIHNLPSTNFATTYAHYLELVARAKMQQSGGGAGIRVWGKEVARGAWEELGSWEVLCPAAGDGGTDGRGSVEGDGRMWRVDVTIEEVGWAVKRAGGLGGMGDVLGRWCREI